MKVFKGFIRVLLIAIPLTANNAIAQIKSDANINPDISKWHPPKYDDTFFNGRSVAGSDALNFWMQSYNWRSNPNNIVAKRSKIELLLSSDSSQVNLANSRIQAECNLLLVNPTVWKKKNFESRQPIIWIELSLRVPEKLSAQTKQSIVSALKALDVTSPSTGYEASMGTLGANGSNAHGYITPLTLSTALTGDLHALKLGKEALYNELNFMNRSGDEDEYNVLESHWTGVASWAIIKKYIPYANLRRVAMLIAERLWIERFLTWSQVVQQTTGPGSRMAPSEWLGTDNSRALLATGLTRPIWLNFFEKWDNWDAKALHAAYENIPTEMSLPDIPFYLQDLAWSKRLPNLLQNRSLYKSRSPYPALPGQAPGQPYRIKKYINYQTENYTIGSSTSSWVANTSNIAASVWWNSNTNAPLGSIERFNVLYPHYVFNGMSTLDKNYGSIFFNGNPGTELSDSKGGPGGPWLREFADYGRVGTIQDRNIMRLSYSGRPGSGLGGQTLVKTKTSRASAGLFLFRWNNSTDGLFINRKPVQSLPAQLNPGDWWFIHDGNTYAAVLPLKATSLKGNCKITLEKRNRHIVLYQDNVNADNIEGISDEDWVKARSGFVIEMGDVKEYGSFANFQTKILAGKVLTDDANGFDRHIVYQREGHKLEMGWNCYTEEYNTRKINDQDDPWVRFAQSPEFCVSDNGNLKVKDASLKTTAGSTLWLLSCTPSNNWIAYQANPDKLLPIDFTSPACRVTTSAFPLGKMVVHRVSANTISIDVDADYQKGQATTPLQVMVGNNITKVNFAVNGVSYEPKLIKRTAKNTYTINAADKLAQIADR